MYFWKQLTMNFWKQLTMILKLFIKGLKIKKAAVAN